ncbi:extracellular calcium-sensing receptor-like [Stylophora pistillata]|uniref:extracellular calcium-sensing receptor-like n=1 Tax=Stylophora pistillata TaxID=50429 RepID=UPI000C04E48A|nr:extracellular calcium-sensing receptor-like [Stylophora pistillata]
MTTGLFFVVFSVCVVLTIPGTAENDRHHQPGDFTLGGLFLLRYTSEDGRCGNVYPTGFAHVEAMIYAIDKINANRSLLPNTTLGYDIRAYCTNNENLMEQAYAFVRRNEIEPTPVVAVIGPSDSGTAVLVASLMQVARIPLISHSATSSELSSPQYRHFFRTASLDGQQASAMADIIERFNWSYVAAVAMVDSYGRNGVWKLESEAAERDTFCVSFVEYIPPQKYTTKLERAVMKLKSYPNIRVVILWLVDLYGRQFLEIATREKLFDRTCEALATNDPSVAVYAVAHALHDMENCSATQCKPLCKLDQKGLENFLRRVDFQGLTGWVRFDQSGDPLTSSFDIVHLQYRNTPLVKAANLELSLILLFAIAMSFSVSITSLAKRTSFVCRLVYCWRPLVLATFISILTVKTIKILSAFQINVIAEWFKKCISTRKSQTLLTLVLIAVPAVFISLWIALDSPRQQRIIRPSESIVFLVCSLHQLLTGQILQIAISVYIVLLAVICTFYAFKARALPENFNEARFIGFSMYILLLSSETYLPIDIGIEGSIAINITCALILLSSYGILICMFGPKIYVILRFSPKAISHQSFFLSAPAIIISYFYRLPPSAGKDDNQFYRRW